MRLRGVALFSVLVAAASPAHAEFEQQLGPLAGAVRQQMLQGWTAAVQDGWFTLRNPATAGSEQTLYLSVGPAPEQGRVTDVNVVVNSQNPKASIGVALNNRAKKSLCLIEITADKSTILFCLEGQNRRDIATVPNLAKLDGSDRIKVVELPGAARFIVNGKIIGDVTDSSAVGGDIGIMAYDVGTFGIADFSINTDLAPRQGAPAQQGSGLPPRSGATAPAPAGLPPRGGSGGGSGGGASAPQTKQAPAPASSDNSGLPGAGPYPRFGGDTLRIVSVYIGIMRSIFMHEFGHALIGELELPSTGAEEDAVDIYAALQIVEPTMYPSNDKDVNTMARDAATYAALQWYYSGKVAESRGASETSAWQDEHTGDLKRFRNMLCIMYGGNPSVFESVAKHVGLEDRTKARCADEFNKQNRAWRRILAPHTRVGTWSPDGQQPANAPGAPVNVTFERSSRKIGNLFANNLSEAISNNIKLLGQTYVLPRPVNVVFKDCGKLNAWYNPREGSITMCYELIENIAVMISDIEMGTVGGEVAAKDGGRAPQQQPQQQPRQSSPGQGMPPSPIDELADMGVPPTSLLFAAPYKGPTPNQIFRAKLVTTGDLVGMIKNDKNLVIVDTSGLADTLPISYPLPDAGSDGSVTDQLQSALDSWLLKKANNNRGASVVFVGAGMNDRSSYNAALRAGSLGWSAYWYRGGVQAWVSNGLPTTSDMAKKN
jgi:rhodanese-related sulfurtransferase